MAQSKQQESPQGVDVCLTCFNGSCRGHNHSALHHSKTSHPLVLNIRTIIKKVRYERCGFRFSTPAVDSWGLGMPVCLSLCGETA